MYREENPQPTHVCIVCCESVGLSGSTCGRCGVPLVTLDDPDVVVTLRKRAKSKKDRPGNRQTIFALLAAGVLGIVALIVFAKLGIYSGRESTVLADESVLIDFWPAVVTFVVLLIPLLLLARRLFPDVAGSKEFDPSTADVPALLKWLAPNASEHAKPPPGKP
jgi:hypothetical protein